MNLRQFSVLAIGLALGLSAGAQNATPASGDANGGGQRGQRTGMGQGGMGGGAGMFGRGIEGTVTEVAADHYTIKNYMGEIYTVHFSANTRFMKQAVGAPGMGQGTGAGQGRAMDPGAGGGQGRGMGRSGQGTGQGGGQRGGPGMGAGGNRPEPIKATDIKVGDAVGAMGEVDASAKSVGAVVVLLMDPQRAKEMQQLEANYGKTWLMGKVTAIDGTKVTLLGSVDNASHSFLADENTVFRKRREPVTMADIAVGDILRVEGAAAGGSFTASTVNVMGAPGDAPTVPRSAPPQ